MRTLHLPFGDVIEASLMALSSAVFLVSAPTISSAQGVPIHILVIPNTISHPNSAAASIQNPAEYQPIKAPLETNFIASPTTAPIDQLTTPQKVLFTLEKSLLNFDENGNLCALSLQAATNTILATQC